MSLSRRDFLIRSSFLAVFSPSVLAACSSDKPSASGGGGSGDAKKVSIAAWPAYLDGADDPTKSPTVQAFTKATGIDVDYQIAIEDNLSFTAKYEGDLKAGRGIGFDLAQPTSWMAAKWIKNGWVEPLGEIANKGNVIDSLAKPAYDPDRSKSLPYSIIQTGIAYYPEKTGFEIATIKDLFKPELKGKITILTEMRDSVGFMLLMNGISPADATVADMLKACDALKKLRDAGQFRKITGNGYIEDLGTGDTAAAMAWSGDVAGIQADAPDLKWVVPTEGGMLSSDTLIIPKGGNVETASAWINFLYDPKNSGPLFEAINYGSPVKGAGDAMSAAGKASPVINPGADVKLITFRDLTDEESAEVETAFVAATQQG
jgi:spermidine/putrescine transport system substrate-binding protein